LHDAFSKHEQHNVVGRQSATLRSEAVAIDQYNEVHANRNPKQIAEEQFEMRAPFGAGETVDNLFTGE
jgi:hypothetical protein